MKIIFHIGWSKTGTSAFQKWLLKNEARLSEKNIFYPKTGRWKEGSHHELALSLRPIKGYQSKHNPQKLWKELLDEIQDASLETPIENVIITSELLPPLFEFPAILEQLENVGLQASLMATVREQVSLLRSLQHQLVADPLVKLTWTVWQLFEDHKKNYLYHEYLKEYEEQYDWKEIIVLKYDSEMIVSKLAEALGWNEEIGEVSYENISPPSEMIEILRQMNTIDMPDDVRIELRNSIKNVFSTSNIKSSAFTEISQDEIEKIKEYYSDSNSKLKDSYGIEF